MLAVVDPRGKQNALTDRIIDLGEDEEKVGPKGPKGFYLASFVPTTKGFTRRLPGRREAYNRGTGPSSSLCGSPRRHSPPSSCLPLSAAKNLKGFDRLIAGEDGVEFIPSITLSRFSPEAR